MSLLKKLAVTAAAAGLVGLVLKGDGKSVKSKAKSAARTAKTRTKSAARKAKSKAKAAAASV